MMRKYAAIVRHVFAALVAIGILVLPTAEGKLLFAALFLADFCYRTDEKLDEIMKTLRREVQIEFLEEIEEDGGNT